MANTFKGIAFLILLATLSIGETHAAQNYYLEQRGTLNPDQWHQVALIFGWGSDNGLMCNDIVKAMTVKVSSAPIAAQFRCVPAE